MSKQTDGEDAVESFEERPVDDSEDHFTANDELSDAFGPATVTYAGGGYTEDEDQLPMPLTDGDNEDAVAPPFTVKMQICVADISSFVIRDAWGAPAVTLLPDDVTGMPDGRYRVPPLVALKAAAAQWSGILDAIRLIVAIVRARAGGWIEAEPRRPYCEHYLRQLEPPAPSEFSQGYTKGWLKRYCTVRRSVAGSFLSLTDTAMSGCSMRSPAAIENRRLDEFDLEQMRRSENRTYLPMFDLASEKIFGTKDEGTSNDKPD